jgi:predicted P-loop ATPase
MTLPPELTARPQWVVWRFENRGGKRTKVPCQPDGLRASSTDTSTWRSYEIASAALVKDPAAFAGVGFVFSADDPFTGIDFDNCLTDAGEPKPWAVPLLQKFEDTYTEISPSGKGIKIFARAKLPDKGKRREYADGAIELYDRGRFFTVTGQAFNGCPIQLKDHQRESDELYSLAGGASAKRVTATAADGKIPQGARHRTLVSFAGLLRKRGASVDAIDAALWAENCARCQPPYDRQHVRQIAESAGQWEKQNSDWRGALIMNKDGTCRALLANAITALRHAPEWDGVLAFNAFALATVALKPAPWPGAAAGTEWSDHEDRLTADWLQHASIMVGVEIAAQAVQSVARDRSFHPVQEYLDSLKWDGTNRLDDWLALYAGAEPNTYTSAVGARWFVSAVARIYQPGAKVDCCLILEGPQGLLKSTALKTIAGPWFTDEIAELGSKDASLQTRGVWIIEIAELDSMTRGEVSKIKAFMSRATDRFRPPYGMRPVECPRQCVFAGSVNHATYLRDETGGRRFWPVVCTRFLIEDLARDRNQLWAEAVARYRGGAVWWLDSDELNRTAEGEQADRYEGDPWDEIIGAWIERPTERYDATGHPLAPFTSDGGSTTVADVLTHCIGKRQDQWGQADKNRVARSLRALGWERYRERDGNSLGWRYRKAGQ